MSSVTASPMTFPPGMSPQLQARLSYQGYAFTRADALELGCTDGQLRAWCRSGQLRTPGYGAYYLPPLTQPGPPFGSPPSEHFTASFENDRDDAVRRIRSIVLTMDESVAVTHQSALLLHGLPVWSTGRSPQVHLSRLGSRRRTRREHVSMHSAHADLQTSLLQNVRVASPEWALAQTNCTLGLEAAVVAADAAAHSGMLHSAQLADACAALVGTRGSATLAQLPSRVDGRSESPGESRLRLLLDGVGFDLTPQRVIRNESGQFVARVDLAVDGTRVLVEFDGMLKYRGADNAGSLVAEKRRELALTRLGYTVVRVTWDDLQYASRIIGWLHTAMATQ